MLNTNLPYKQLLLMAIGSTLMFVSPVIAQNNPNEDRVGLTCNQILVRGKKSWKEYYYKATGNDFLAGTLTLGLSMIFPVANCLPVLAQPKPVNSQQFKQAKYLPELRGIKPIDKTQKLKTITKRNIKLEQAIKKYTDYSGIAKQMNEHQLAKYFYNYIDLNGDNKPELVVHLYGLYFCGTGGCTTIIFKQVGSEYRLVSEIGVSSTPIIVTNQKTSGWNNLIIGERIDSQGNGGYFLLKFDGKTYPDMPGQRTRIRQNIIMGTELMSDIDSVRGIVIHP